MADWLDNRHAIVTGAARGIGFAVSQTLALLGARVLLVDNGCAIDGSPEDPAVTELAAARVPGSESLALDVAAPGSGKAIVDAAIEAFGAVDLIIHAAGIQAATDDGATSREMLEQVLAVDVLAAAELFEAALPRFRAQHAEGRLPGAIVSLVSAEAVYGDPDLFVEAVGKGALLALTRSMSHRVAPLGVGCNAVIPMAGTRQLDNGRKFSSERQAFHRAMRPLAPTSVANLIAWLCTPLAAGINGQVFMARGREILLFSQSRPAESFFQSQLLEPDELAQSMKEIRRELTDDWTVPDAFGNDPVP
ncbi:MAG: SDR family oxidoreductase [Burkholderiaceae bacterium]